MYSILVLLSLILLVSNAQVHSPSYVGDGEASHCEEGSFFVRGAAKLLLDADFEIDAAEIRKLILSYLIPITCKGNVDLEVTKVADDEFEQFKVFYTVEHLPKDVAEIVQARLDGVFVDKAMMLRDICGVSCKDDVFIFNSKILGAKSYLADASSANRLVSTVRSVVELFL